ncbi:MFS transporter [Microbacterium sp. Sa4CUA7]|uniref:MFS transporter n=1 Tax=Microbacterium pullorum TaxID=2762236 RepID=A0ABR8S5C8_9MICO|nr:MFS transporter [Microbacterium pullorum]MBD7958676.1 MFS transporter [Microbacterium pullorum]
MTHPTPPRPRVGAGWFTLFTLAWLALWAVQLVPIQLLLPLQLDTPDDADGWISGVIWSGIVLAAGGVAAIVVGPIAGALSDRTRSRLGRRRPWALGGSWLAAAALVATAFAEGPWLIGAAWIGVSVGFAAASAAFTALIADQLTTQRGAASGAVGSAQALGLVVGVGVIALLQLDIVTGYLLLAALMAVVGTAAALLLPDPVVDVPPARGHRAHRPDTDTATPAHPDSTRTHRFAALRDPDFLWVVSGRLVVNVGNGLGTALLLFFLLYGLRRPAAGAEDDLLLLILVYTVFVVLASVAGGWVSDRTQRRTGIVVASALIQAVAAVLLAVAPAYGTTFIAGALLGVGYGAFTSVGLALATDLLPSDADHARDLGIVNVAANLGQLLGPLIGALLVAAVGGFWLLFAAAAACSVAGALMTARVRPARSS